MATPPHVHMRVLSVVKIWQLVSKSLSSMAASSRRAFPRGNTLRIFTSSSRIFLVMLISRSRYSTSGHHTTFYLGSMFLSPRLVSVSTHRCLKRSSLRSLNQVAVFDLHLTGIEFLKSLKSKMCVSKRTFRERWLPSVAAMCGEAMGTNVQPRSGQGICYGFIENQYVQENS